MDLFTVSPTSEDGYKYCLLVVEHFSHFPMAYPLKAMDAETVAKALFRHFCTFGTFEERYPPILPLRDRVYLASLTDQERHALGCELHQRAHWHDKQMCFRISVRKALRERESEARKAIEAELQQMLTMKVWHGVLLGDLKSDERKRILRVVVFLKDKFTASGVFDKFKARLCVNGSGQDHEMYTDVSSPSTEAGCSTSWP